MPVVPRPVLLFVLHLLACADRTLEHGAAPEPTCLVRAPRRVETSRLVEVHLRGFGEIGHAVAIVRRLASPSPRCRLLSTDGDCRRYACEPEDQLEPAAPEGLFIEPEGEDPLMFDPERSASSRPYIEGRPTRVRARSGETTPGFDLAVLGPSRAPESLDYASEVPAGSPFELAWPASPSATGRFNLGFWPNTPALTSGEAPPAYFDVRAPLEVLFCAFPLTAGRGQIPAGSVPRGRNIAATSVSCSAEAVIDDSLVRVDAEEPGPWVYVDRD